MSNERLNGETVARYRMANNLSPAAMAAKIGVSPSTYRQMEEGYLPKKHRDTIVQRLTKLMNTDAATLVIAGEAA